MKSTLLAKCYYKPFKNSFAQYGEDVVIDRLLDHKRLGFYVDVGAFDPSQRSNTKRFYLKGWSGINIEPNPDKIAKFNSLRPRDINLSIGIADKEGMMAAYRFKDSTSYTLSKDFVAEKTRQGFGLEQELNVKVNTLEEVFDEHLGGRCIDFVSIDAEGYDLAVLRSNNWEKYRPRLVCIESFNIQDRGYGKKQEAFLIKRGYRKVYDNGLNSFYVEI